MTDACTIEPGPDGTLRLAGPLTFRSVTGLFRDLEKRQQETAGSTTVDLAAITGVDSAGLALLLEWQSRQRRLGHELTIHSAPESLVRLAGLCESLELLNLSGRTDPT